MLGLGGASGRAGCSSGAGAMILRCPRKWARTPTHIELKSAAAAALPASASARLRGRSLVRATTGRGAVPRAPQRPVVRGRACGGRRTLSPETSEHRHRAAHARANARALCGCSALLCLLASCRWRRTAKLVGSCWRGLVGQAESAGRVARGWRACLAAQAEGPHAARVLPLTCIRGALQRRSARFSSCSPCTLRALSEPLEGSQCPLASRGLSVPASKRSTAMR